jgi:hypothetical protein
MTPKQAGKHAALVKKGLPKSIARKIAAPKKR